ncbi:hypothetical protein [Deinococcus sedimenti]|uniref:Uncharacterized protein n=1 Tax=Deinococcus sedimenti TaxID=1867090 RepID=A0ABQ2S381_9DEIO|nr:hypothetical protein [Deinococcus sedimenti]GGR93328.1 hypothetical protein GCM10008960_20400 [Deinococcus sedimenti]
MLLEPPEQRAYATGKIGVITAAYLLTLHNFYDQPSPHSALTRARMTRLTAQLWTQAQHVMPLWDEEYVHSSAVDILGTLLDTDPSDRAEGCAAILCTAASNIAIAAHLDQTEAAANLLGLAMYHRFRLERSFTPPQPALLVRSPTSREQLYFEVLHHVGFQANFVDDDADELWQGLQERLRRRLEVAPQPSQPERVAVERYRELLSTVTNERTWIGTSLHTIAGSYVPYDPTYTAWTADSCLEALIAQRRHIVE